MSIIMGEDSILKHQEHQERICGLSIPFVSESQKISLSSLQSKEKKLIV